MASFVGGPIERAEWGSFVVEGEKHATDEEGRKGAGKDIRVVGRTVTRWKERKGHDLTPEMITGVFDCGVETILIGIGWEGALRCSDKVLKSIRKRGISDVRTARTPDACAEYNRLFQKGQKVALLAHGTC